MENSELSIAMATFNGEQFLREQLDSILKQTVQPFELVVCDDKSSDGTLEILREYKEKLNIKLYINENSVGVIKNFQKAISLCAGAYIALCDQDDVWLETKLENSLKLMNRVEKDSKLPALVFSDLSVVDKNLQIISASFWKHLKANPLLDNFYTILFGNVVTGCTSMINRALAVELRAIPTEAIMHDYWAALIAFGYGQVGVIDEPLVYYRQHSENITDNYKRSLSNRLKDFVKFLINDYDFYLEAELKQARAFKCRFGQCLTLAHSKDLEKFLSLEKASAIRRKWESFKSNNLN